MIFLIKSYCSFPIIQCRSHALWLMSWLFTYTHILVTSLYHSHRQYPQYLNCNLTFRIMVPCPHKGKGLEWTLTWTILDLLTRHARKIARAAVGLAHNPLEIIPIYHGLLTLRVVLDILAQLMIVPMQISPRFRDGQISMVLKATSESIMQSDSVGK